MLRSRSAAFRGGFAPAPTRQPMKARSRQPLKAEAWILQRTSILFPILVYFPRTPIRTKGYANLHAGNDNPSGYAPTNQRLTIHRSMPSPMGRRLPLDDRLRHVIGLERRPMPLDIRGKQA